MFSSSECLLGRPLSSRYRDQDARHVFGILNEGLHNEESVYRHTHQPACHRDTLTLINCACAKTFGHRGAANTTKPKRLPSLTPEGNVRVYGATRSITQTSTDIPTTPQYEIFMNWIGLNVNALIPLQLKSGVGGFCFTQAHFLCLSFAVS